MSALPVTGGVLLLCLWGSTFPHINPKRSSPGLVLSSLLWSFTPAFMDFVAFPGDSWAGGVGPREALAAPTLLLFTLSPKVPCFLLPLLCKAPPDTP